MSSGSTIHTILQCFVDINLETDENATYFLNLLDVSFDKSVYSVDEGQIVEATVSLSSPSVNGYEEVEVGVVANYTSLSDFDTLGETYPRTLTFSAGQQSHTLKFLANSDFLEEGDESFDLILGFFTNVTPGQIITSKVQIADLTDLKEVFISEQNASLNPITNALTFTALEGFSREITISLSSASDFGIEEVDILFTNNTANSLDYSVIGSTHLTWSIGEQHKTININAIDDGIIEDIETFNFELANPVFVNIINPNTAVFDILDNSPETRYIQINFQGLYTQIGGFNFHNIANLRHIVNNEEIDNGSGEETMLLKFGENFVSKMANSYNGPALANGSNCIQTIANGPFQNGEITNTVFFGKNSSTGVYGDVRLKIISRGQFPVIINGTQLNKNDSITLDVNAFDYKLTLPANDVLLNAGAFIGTNLILEDTISEALYEFVLETDYAEREFVLKNLSNAISSNKEINLGVHRFEETYTISDATVITNQHNLVTTYNQVLANWYNYPNYNSSKTCLPLAYYNNGNFPANPPDAISVVNGHGHARINGFAILSDNSKYHINGAGDGPSPYEESRYIGIEFLPSGQTIGITCTPITYPGTSYKTAWTSLPFEIIP